jgi:site-specific DNA recombinase
MQPRAAIYARVSTTRQAERDLSIPDQLAQARKHAKAKGWVVVKEYVEPGASGTTANRPLFQQMMADAQGPDSPFDRVIVHSFSRLFRDAFELEFTVRSLRKKDIALVSITQETEDDPMGHLVRQVLALFDEYQSKETAKHTLRAMKENARQGFWNGSVPSYGYKVVDAGIRGDKMKRKLAINEIEANVVRLIYDSYTGAKTGLPKGVKATTDWLNRQGYRTRQGRTFSTGLTYRILTGETYAGTHWFNKTDSRTGKTKGKSHWVSMPCPAIISEETFKAVKAQLSARNPKTANSRNISSPTLLTGLAKCSKCGGAMMLRTGKGQGGKIYSYYTCSTAALKGKIECSGQSVPMDKLDRLIVEQLTDQVFTPKHVAELLAELNEKKPANTKAINSDIRKLQSDLDDTRKRLDRLYLSIEEGITELDEDLKTRIGGLKSKREKLNSDIDIAKNPSSIPMEILKPKHIDRFCEAFRKTVLKADKPIQKGLINLFIDRITVDKDNSEITITGSNDALLAALTANDASAPEKVRRSVREWCPRRDSNSRPPD